MSTSCFETIRNLCWHGGRPLVPVFGAGISVESGIPLMGAIGDYLVDLEHFISNKEFCERSTTVLGVDAIGDAGRKYLTQFGWPDRHMLRQFLRMFSKHRLDNAHERPEWLKVLTPLGNTYPDLKRLLAKHNPTNRPDWWELLSTLTTSDDSLKDLLFSQLVADAQPSTPHQYAAFLAGIMNWQLIITTNFDSLLERALYDQGMRTTVYELLPNVDLPDPALVTKSPSVIKLHGGTYSLLAGSILNVPIDYKTQEHFLRFFPRNSLLLILGYRGDDLRVRRLIEAVCDHFHRELEMQLSRQHRGRTTITTAVWVYRSQLPEDSERLKKVGVEFVHYGDAGSYLQELYTRLTSTIPVSTASFRALAHIPPCSDDNWLQDEVTSEKYLNASTVVFTRRTEDCGTSAALIRNVHQLSKDHQPVWCQLERIDTVNGLIAHLQREFRRIDRDLPVFSLFRPEIDCKETPDNVLKNDPRIEWILDAMRRHAYVIAIDAVGEFGNAFSGPDGRRHPSAVKIQELESKKLRDLIETLISRSSDFGNSKLRVSYTPQQHEVDKWRIANGSSDPEVVIFNVTNCFTSGARDDKILRATRPFVLNPYCDNGVEKALKELGVRGFIDHNLKDDLNAMCCNDGATSPRRALAEQCVSLFWKAIRNRKLSLLLAIACAFRRSRPLAALRRLVIPFWNHSDVGTPARPFGDSFPANPWDAPLPEKDRKELGEILDLLEQARVMVPQEGGFYWIHRLVREALWSNIDVKNPEDNRTAPSIARLHDMIATYYYEHIFLKSKDHEAMVEYLFHRASSLDSGSTDEIAARLKDFLTVLRRERDHLLSHSKSETLIRWARHFNEAVFPRVSQESDIANRGDVLDQLQESFCDLQAEVYRQKNDCKWRISLRVKQIKDRLNELKPVAGQSKIYGLLVDSMVDFPDFGESDTYSDDAAVYRQPLSDCLGRILDAVNAFLADLNAEASSDTFRTALSDLSEVLRFKLHRLVDHVIDLAASMTRLGLDIEIVNSGAMALPRSCELLVRLRLIINQILTSQNISISPTARTLGLRLLIRACFRLMEAALAPITPWHKPDITGRLLKLANDAYEEGSRALREYQGYEPRDQQRYACFLNTLRARSSYYQYGLERGGPEQFLLAHQFLDSAQAAINPPQSGSEHSALAVCHLHRVECLMLDANHWLESSTSVS